MFSRKETAKILGISLKTLDALREDKRIGYYFSHLKNSG